jgi:hypothetical protein
MPMTQAVIKNHIPAHGPLTKNDLSAHTEEPTQQSTAYDKPPKIKHKRPANRSDLIRFTILRRANAVWASSYYKNV